MLFSSLIVIHTWSPRPIYSHKQESFFTEEADSRITPSVSSSAQNSILRRLTEKVQTPSSAAWLFKDLLRHAGSVLLLRKHMWETESCWQRYTQKNEIHNTESSFLRIHPHGIRTRLCSSFIPTKSTPWETSSCFLWKMCSANKVAEEAGWMSLRGVWKYQGQFI